MPGASSSVSLTFHPRPCDRPLLRGTPGGSSTLSGSSQTARPRAGPLRPGAAPGPAPALSPRRCPCHRFTQSRSRLERSCPRGHWVTCGDICAVTLGAPGIEAVGPEMTGLGVPEPRLPAHSTRHGDAASRGHPRLWPRVPFAASLPLPACDRLHTCRPSSRQGRPEPAAPAGTWRSVSPATRAFRVSW